MTKMIIEFRHKSWLCLTPIAMHLVFLFVTVVLSNNLPPLQANDMMGFKMQAMFIILCYIYSASFIFLLPLIFISIYYAIAGKKASGKKFKRQISPKACMVYSIVGATLYLGVAIGGLIFGAVYIFQMSYYMVFCMIIAVAICYIGIVIFFAKDSRIKDNNK